MVAQATPVNAAIGALRQHLEPLADLRHVSHLLVWDRETRMPARGSASRAESLATIERIAHERFASQDTGRLLEAAAAELDGAPPDSDDASLVRVLRRRWEKARRVPGELAAELARAASLGERAWVTARAESSFASFAPYLERNVELARRYVDCHRGVERFRCAYDVLLDDYEPELQTEAVSALFEQLKSRLVPLIATLLQRRDEVSDACLHGSFPIAGQRRLVAEVVGRMGFQADGWRLDEAVHPMAVGLGAGDVRISTRWDESFLPSGLYAAMHECGHGLYEEGVDRALQRTPLEHAESLGLHESQSRLWENMVGRGRAFCEYLAPRAAELFGERSGLEPEALYRALNRVSPSLIRVEADEATYGLHVVLRFELEQQLIEGTIAVGELPEAWNDRVQRYLGLEVPDDARGVLQDPHWAAGMFGYFPTYALGNMIAAQLWEQAHAELAGLESQLSAGELTALREWLRARVHRHGAKFTAAQLLARVVGAPISVLPFVEYLERKLGEIYGPVRV